MAVRKTSIRRKLFGLFILASILITTVVFLVSREKVEINAVACGGDLSGEITSEKFAFFEGKKIEVPELAMIEAENAVLGVATSERWIEVDLSEQKIRAWEGGSLFLESLVSTGLPWWPTPKGEFRIWAKARATKMEGGAGKNYYYLPNVPYVMFFENEKNPNWRGYSLHGTYWHNDFGRVRSHGCVNLPTPVAEQLYNWVGPVMPEGKRYVRVRPENPGTRVVIHE